jgi:hypothetical protein
MARREDSKNPFKTPREPRPKGAQRGVAKRDNGRTSPFGGARNYDKNASKGWPFHR